MQPVKAVNISGNLVLPQNIYCVNMAVKGTSGVKVDRYLNIITSNGEFMDFLNINSSLEHEGHLLESLNILNDLAPNQFVRIGTSVVNMDHLIAYKEGFNKKLGLPFVQMKFDNNKSVDFYRKDQDEIDNLMDEFHYAVNEYRKDKPEYVVDGFVF